MLDDQKTRSSARCTPEVSTQMPNIKFSEKKNGKKQESGTRVLLIILDSMKHGILSL